VEISSDKLFDVFTKDGGRYRAVLMGKTDGTLTFRKDNGITFGLPSGNILRMEKVDPQARDRELLKKHRSEFCLSVAEGQEYIESISRMELIAQYVQKADQKRTDPDYKKVSKLKKLSVVELEKLITETMEKEKYLKLMLEKPDIDRYVIVPFTLQDADSSRVEADSVRRFHRIIKKALEGTNWRLMSEGVHYRLGYLSGRLKGYEQEEDLFQLVKAHSTVGNTPCEMKV